MASEFGALADGRPVLRATISGHGLTVSVITLGASVQDIRLDGIDHPLVLGFPTLDPYLGEGRYMGAIVGRYANRIGHGRTVLDGQVLDDNLHWCGKDHAWLERTAQANTLLVEEILLLIGNDTEDYFLLKKEPRRTARPLRKEDA